MTLRLPFALLMFVAPAVPAPAAAPACGTFVAGSDVVTCSCGAGDHDGAVWGSGPYTADSDICAAAVHAGVIGPEGGEVTARAVTPPESFPGTISNGVVSESWGPYDSAFSFKEAAGPAGLPLCGLLGDADELTCHCPAGSATNDSVWGSGPYTSDSDICSAATHAGVLGEEGGDVTVRRAPGQPSYAASTANGITTQEWGAYEWSLEVLPKD